MRSGSSTRPAGTRAGTFGGMHVPVLVCAVLLCSHRSLCTWAQALQLAWGRGRCDAHPSAVSRAHSTGAIVPTKPVCSRLFFPLQESQTNLLSKDLFCLWRLQHDQVTGTLRPGGSLGLCLPQLVPPLCQVSNLGHRNFCYIRMTETVKAVSWWKS